MKFRSKVYSQVIFGLESLVSKEDEYGRQTSEMHPLAPRFLALAVYIPFPKYQSTTTNLGCAVNGFGRYI